MKKKNFEDNFTRITTPYEVPDKDWIQSKSTEYLKHLNPHNRKFRRAIAIELNWRKAKAIHRRTYG